MSSRAATVPNPAADDPPDPAAPTETDRLTDEFRRQIAFLREERWVRAVATALAYGMGLIYLPAALILALALCDLAIEIALHRLMADPARMARSARRRRLANLLVFGVETCFALPAVVIWHVPDPYAKALAIGLLAGSMMHMATVRAIHLPQGLSGAAAMSLLIFGSNVAYWAPQGEWRSLLLTSLCGLVATGYFVAAMISNHRLHRDMAERRRIAQAADAAKGRFLARMSHELRTPLNAILGLAHAELRRARDPGQAARLAVLVASAEGLATVLDDSLDAEAVQGGGVAIRLRAAEPATAIAAVADLFRPRIDEAGLHLTLDIGPGLNRPAMLDSHRLGQCLSNLLSNALRHTVRGGIAVTARLVDTAQGGALLQVDVADTGPGIAADRRAGLFEATEPPLPRHGALPDQRRGLGLSIARDLARRMGGDLVLADSAADGARFRLTVALPAAPVPRAAPPSADADTAVLAGQAVLVVDDLATNRMVAATCLRLLGARPEEAAGGAEALARLAQGGIDAVLLDLNMPGLDGLGTLAAIRTLPGPAARVHVVAMTADAMPEDRARGLAAGLDGYLVKPITPDRLAAALAPRAAT